MTAPGVRPGSIGTGAVYTVSNDRGLHAVNPTAAGGDWPSAIALFAETLEKASGLRLSLEIARVQAAWGEAALQHTPTSGEGRALLAAARAILLAHNARADLASLP